MTKKLKNRMPEKTKTLAGIFYVPALALSFTGSNDSIVTGVGTLYFGGIK